MSPNDEVMEYFTQLTREADVQIFGRKTYELMFPYWPEVANDPSASKADRDFAQAFIALQNVVFSRSLERVEDSKTKIVRTGLRDEILKLKQEEGKSILVGGVDLAAQLIELGLVDEFRFVVHPVIVGQGRRLLDGARLPAVLHLKLADSRTFKLGCVVLRYVKQ
jgi:dihydrofolate reductase